MTLMAANFACSWVVAGMAVAAMRMFHRVAAVRAGFGALLVAALFNVVVIAANWVGRPVGVFDSQCKIADETLPSLLICLISEDGR